MRKLFVPLLILSVLMFAAAPVLIAQAPYEATMGLIQKIFYFHVPAAMMMMLSSFICGIWSAIFLLRKRPEADRIAVAGGELVVVFGLIVLVTGPLWARIAWGVWWVWDVRLTSALLLWMIFCGYLLVRRYGGPGSDKLGAAMAIFGMANVPFVYISVDIWRTMHPKTTVVTTLGEGMAIPFWFCVFAFLVVYALLFTARVQLENERARVEQLFLEAGDL
ncbi:MAG TPA: cytochrome c biogenesis protein CcsA [Vicinamibacterales bacterium]|nr:cytochrome c biogenesis protein CcsA [Vicinamibacterales bacterium]